jgi:hypothetical protein
LLVTVDGQVLGGTLEADAVSLKLTSGQVTRIPLGQISRIGYRRRSGEPEQWSSNGPMVVLRSGERVGIQTPADSVEMATPYGNVRLPAGSIVALQLQDDEAAVHQAQLTDGSRLSGLLTATAVDLKLRDADRVVQFPVSSISRIQFLPAAGDNETDSAALSDAPLLAIGDTDLLVGSLTGILKLDTAFDTLSVNAAEMKRLSHMESAWPLDVQLQLWDNTVVSGQLQSPAVRCRLNCGIELDIPVPLLTMYVQPQPQPPPGAVERITQLVAELSSTDWSARDRAEAQLISMGNGVVSVLRNLQGSQPPEAQQRIDTILDQFRESPAAGANVPEAPSAVRLVD